MGAADRLDTAWRDEAARIDQEMTTLTQDLTDTRAIVEDLQDRLGEEQQTTADLTRRLAASDAAVADLDARLQASTALVEQHAATVAQQTVTIDQQRARIAELEAHECAPTASEPFVIGDTMPQSTAIGDPVTNVGRLTVDEPRRVYDGPIPIVGSDDPLRPLPLVGYDFPKIATVASGHVHIDLSRLRGSNATSDSGLVDARAAAVKHVKVTRSELDPGPSGRSHRLSGVIGHHLTVEQCLARGVVDFANLYNEHSPDVDSVIRGNLLEWHLYDYNPVKGIVHPSDYRVHADFAQIQGGRGVVIEGNRGIGWLYYADGITVPTDQGTDEWTRLAGNFVMVQQNVQRGTPIDPIVIRNWLEGYQAGIVARTVDYDKGTGTAYILEAWGNRVPDEKHRWYSVTGTDMYGVKGGKWYGLRLDNMVTLRRQDGTIWSPRTDHVEFAAGVATYGTDSRITEKRRGKDVPGRRDAFAGGKAPA